MTKSGFRKQKVLDLLAQKGKLTVSEIADAFDISLPTSRRFCALLAKEGKVVRTHGGIQNLPDIQTPYYFDIKAREHNEEKQRIAQYASELVKDNQVIFLEAGTTVRECAINIAGRIKRGDLNNVMVFTNSLVNLEIMSSVCKISLVGGLYRPERQDFIGYLCERTIRGLRFDMAFIGADAVNINDGIMAQDIETVRFDELLASRAEETIILVNSAKFQKHSLISFAGVRDVTNIITDNQIPAEILQEYQLANINIVCV